MRLALALALLTLFPASAGGAAPPPILYQSTLECPAHRSCHGDPRYFSRILAIDRIGHSSRQVSIGRFSDSNPAWSPNHEQIAFTRESPKLGAGYQLWVMDADGSRARRLTHGRVNTEPSWAPDGKQLVFRGLSRDGKSFDLFVVDEDGAGLHRITSNPTRQTQARASTSWARTARG